MKILMGYKKVVYVVKEALHMFPPCVSQILMLNDNGVEVVVVCGDCDVYTLNLLKERNIQCILIGNKRINLRIIGKIGSYLKYRYKAWRKIRKFYNENTIIWFGTADGAIALSGKYKNKSYVLSILELYDKYPFYKIGLKRVIGRAKAVVVCEVNRARIMKSWWGLKKLPYVLPNKPYEIHDLLKHENNNVDLKNAISALKNKRVILYQGIISKDRDLGVLAEALKELKSNYTLVLVGKSLSSWVEKVKEIYADTAYLGYFPAPLHLQITKYAHIGIAHYDDSSLNNIFCAPNKIFEYTYFGIPVLGSDVPGLNNTIDAYRAGKCVDFKSKEAVINAIVNIEKNYDSYVLNAKKFYESVNNGPTMKKIIEEIN